MRRPSSTLLYWVAGLRHQSYASVGRRRHRLRRDLEVREQGIQIDWIQIRCFAYSHDCHALDGVTHQNSK